jgi:hypothetical protein
MTHVLCVRTRDHVLRLLVSDRVDWTQHLHEPRGVECALLHVVRSEVARQQCEAVHEHVCGALLVQLPHALLELIQPAQTNKHGSC